MAKEDAAPGLLSKMVKFVRNPATSWTDQDAKETDRDEAISRRLLKEVIERKRRDDFVRKREFDMLRKLRKSDPMVGQDSSAQPSFFHSSLPSNLDDRAKTLKKIDEIEAQMSMQWWKTKPGNVSSIHPRDSAASSNLTDRVVISGTSAQARGTLPPQLQMPVLDNALPLLDEDYEPTQRVGLLPQSQTPAVPAKRAVIAADLAVKPLKRLVMGGLAGPHYEGGASGFGHTNLMAVDVSEIAHDAELEEASIRFANGDNVGAEAGLQEMLAPGGSRAGQSEAWMALFDLYRATDQQEKFENAALKYVQKFERSAPQWFSMPDMVKAMAVPAIPVVGNGPVADWVCPSSVGIQTTAALKAALAKAPMPWRLDWRHLKTIEPVAVEALAKVFADWSAQPVQLRFIGNDQLQQVLQRETPSGQRGTLEAWWQLRMEALRVTHRPDEFELAALDFCVTYEVSPPSWEAARCHYKAMDNQGLPIFGNTIIGEVSSDFVPSSLNHQEADTQMDAVSSQMLKVMSVDLSGQIEGDALTTLEKLETKLMGADIMMISCARLIRVDFSAAGALLNWVSARQSEGRAVHFSDMNRLVAAFFNVMGITEHAKVMTRFD